MKYRTSVLSLYLRWAEVIPTASGSTPRHNQYLILYVTLMTALEKKNYNYWNFFFFRYKDTHSHRSTFNICVNRAAQLTQIVIVTTASVSGTWCCFQRARGEGEGHVEVCTCVCVYWSRGGGVRGGVGVQPRVSPVSMCQPISLFLHVTDTHVGTHQPKLLQLTAVPLRCPFVRCASLGDKIWSGNCLSSDIRREF